ncbi:hypothetical protein Atai01_54960 [Amycolatopsis taiwanensis]|uniref:Uncharacterized protein n=1 Tax=Amycolatopsis taiwanensis TaxID=342230 RepID=A0A9W6R7B9_9PSEU|nr:hypothetical protein Atai01_54960 [Amycolatopsis taiwanensis]
MGIQCRELPALRAQLLPEVAQVPAAVVHFGMLVIRAPEGPGYRPAGTNRFGKEPRSAEPVRS